MISPLTRETSKNIKQALPETVSFISVVKADAYGHGLPQIVERSLQSGIKTFAVANIQEATEIRNVGVGWPILLLGALMPEKNSTFLIQNSFPLSVALKN